MLLRTSLKILIALLIMGCATSTRVTGTWKKDMESVYTFDKIAILGLAHDAATRKIFETALEERMLEKGYSAEAALDFLPPNANEDNLAPEIVNAIFQSSGVDAVLTIHLLRVDDSRRFVPDGRYYAPYYVSYSFEDHHTTVHEYVMVPGYFTGELDVFLEANLFDFASGQLIWSAQTETTELSELHEIADSFSAVLADDLARSQVLTSASSVD